MDSPLRGGQAKSSVPCGIRLDAALVDHVPQRAQVVTDDCGRECRRLLIDPFLDLAVFQVIGPPSAEPRADSLPVNAVVLACPLVDVDPGSNPERKPVVQNSPGRISSS